MGTKIAHMNKFTKFSLNFHSNENILFCYLCGHGDVVVVVGNYIKEGTHRGSFLFLSLSLGSYAFVVGKIFSGTFRFLHKMPCENNLSFDGGAGNKGARNFPTSTMHRRIFFSHSCIFHFHFLFNKFLLRCSCSLAWENLEVYSDLVTIERKYLFLHPEFFIGFFMASFYSRLLLSLAFFLFAVFSRRVLWHFL